MSSSLTESATNNLTNPPHNPNITNSLEKSYKCYLRLPNMHSIIHHISPEQSINEIKQKAKELFNLTYINDLDSIKLIVNEVELDDEIDLNECLYNNVIVHVVVVVRENEQEQEQEQSTTTRTTTISLRIKEPPVNCPIYTIPSIDTSQPVKHLKSTILSYYKTEHPESDISNINENELYLVYGGRVLMDENIVKEYGIVDDSGIVYVVNGRVYVREVTRAEAERRVNEVKRGIISKDVRSEQQQQQEINEELEEQKPEHHLGSELHPEEAADTIVEFNIIQNIVHDTDSDVEGETANDLTRSQKFIQRYNSISDQYDGEEKEQEQEEQEEQEQEEQEQEEQEEQEQEEQTDNNNNNNEEEYILSGKGNTYKQIDIVKKDSNENKELSWEERITVDNYLDFVNHQVADYQATRELFYYEEQRDDVNVEEGEEEEQQEQKREEEQQEPKCEEKQEEGVDINNNPILNEQQPLNDQLLDNSNSSNNNNDEMLI